MLLFSIYDSKAGIFTPPFTALSVGQAIRNFGDTARDPNTTINRHPVDYSLFQIGAFDDRTCTIEIIDRVNLGTADQLMQ